MCDVNTLKTSYHFFFQCVNARDRGLSMCWSSDVDHGRSTKYLGGFKGTINTIAIKGTKGRSGLYYSWLFYGLSGGNKIR